MIFIKILAIIIAIISVLCVIAIFTPKKYTITREILIDQKPSNVYDFVRFHKNQKLFNQWLSFDPNTAIEIKGSEDGEEGSILFFKSAHKKTGTGEWENIRLVKNERIDLELRFLAPYTFTANGSLLFIPIKENKTKMVWEYHSGMDWPRNITLLFVNMDKIIGADIESTLEKIKINTEK